MHNAPAVSYPVGRSRFQGWLLSVISLLGIFGAVGWFVQADVTGWRQWLALSGAALTAVGVWWQLRHPLIGKLAWDGVVWTWTELEADVPVRLAVIADVQRAMLLMLHGARGSRALWIWVDRDASPGRWLALRRAVHQRARQNADPRPDAQHQGAPQP